MDLSKLIEIVREKIDLDKGTNRDASIFFDEIISEVKETKYEYDNRNMNKLEDELGDILRDYLNLLIRLDKGGYVDHRKVLNNVEEKYRERIEGVKNGISWEEIKENQKIRNNNY